MPGRSAHGAATEAGDVVERGLDHLVVAADEVGLVGADGDGQPLVPVGLVDGVAVGGPGVADRRRVAGTRARGQGPGGEAERGQAEEVRVVGGRLATWGKLRTRKSAEHGRWGMVDGPERD